jgi:PGF-pre-PGF domain-containing protein
MKNKPMFILLTIFLLFSINVFAFSGDGTGTSEDPYQITSWAQLNEIRDALSASYVLMNDLDSGDANYATYGADWTPIGCGGPSNPRGTEACASGTGAGNFFTGDLNGNGHVISDIIIYSEISYVGFFGAANSGATINDLNLANITVTGHQIVGGLIGRMDSGVINNVHITDVNSSVLNTRMYTGGLIGYATDVLIMNSSSSAQITAKNTITGGLLGQFTGSLTKSHATGNVTNIGGNSVGGLIGILGNGTDVNFSYATGDVNGTGSIGGLIGTINVGTDGSANIEYSYATGDVNASGNEAGGLTGLIYSSGTKTITNCYSRGNIYPKVSGLWYLGGFIGAGSGSTIENSYSTGLVSQEIANSNYGGFMASAASAIPCDNSFWDVNTSGTTTNSSNCPAIGLDTIQMKTESTFTDAGWDFLGAWAIDGTETINDGYPYLTGLPAVINSAPDLNILRIGGYNANAELPVFSYVKDGNVSIDFNVMDVDAGDTLTVDLNYSSENTQGTGTVIVSGLVLDATVCDDADFTNSTNCSWDFNIHSTLVTDGNYYILALISDGTDSDFNASDNNFMIDNTAPLTAMDYNATWQNTDANVTALSITDAGSGVALTQYRLDTDSSDSVSMGEWQTFDANILITADGNWAIDFNSTDNAENIEDTNRIYVLIDKTAPTVNADYNAIWQNSDANVLLSCSDAHSGCTNIYYRIDTDSGSGVSYGSWQTYDTNILFNADGNYAIDFNALDNIGNWSDTNTIHVLIDKTAPSVSITSPADGSSQTSTTVLLEYSGSDANSGIAKYWVSNDGNTWIDNSTNLTYSFTSQSGTNTYYVRATDNADNNSSDANVTVTITPQSTGGGAFEQLPEGLIRKQTTIIQKESSQTLSYSSNDDAIVSIKLIAKNKINSGNLDKTELNELEEKKLLIENVFKYVKITFSESNNLSEAVIKFRVSKEWLKQNNANRNDVVLMRLIENEWIELETKLSQGDNDYFYYEAVTPGFSYFAIKLKEKIIEEKPIIEEKEEQEKPKETITEQEKPKETITEPEQEKPKETITEPEKSEFNLIELVFTSIVIVLVLGIFGFIYLNKKKSEKPKLGFP